MAHIEDIAGKEDLRTTLMAMDQPELMAQQITQQGAMHALETLLMHGCTERTANDMLASLRSNMLVIEAVARDKGFTPLFANDDEAQRVQSPAEQFHEAVLAIVGELMRGDPSMESADGRLLVNLADAVEAYEKVVYPMPSDGAAETSGTQVKEPTEAREASAQGAALPDGGQQ
jgi:hypothetical protein